MKTSSTPAPRPNDMVDEARNALCRNLAEGLRGGASAFQIRFHRTHDTPTEAWVYSHTKDDWRKRDDLPFGSSLVADLYDQFVILASREYADIWTLRRTDHSDRTDFELKFRHEAIADHVKDGLETYLMGCLFLGRHDSGKDSRHRMGFRGR